MNLSTRYQKMSQLDHIRTRPDTYIGSDRLTELDTYIFNSESQQMEMKKIRYIPGLFTICDEILTNASDHAKRCEVEQSRDQVTRIDVTIDPVNREISIYNDGTGIDVAVHPEHHVYIPAMIFGELLTSTNYDESQERLWGGRNGYGAKLTNIFSTMFRVETVDGGRHKCFIKTWYDNMSRSDPEEIRDETSRPYTRITFRPDLSRFHIEDFTQDFIDLLVTRIIDLTAVTNRHVGIYLNGQPIACPNFEKYVDFYIGAKSEKPRAYIDANDRWSVAVTVAEEHSFQQVSFVNGVHTFRGGKHVEYITNQIVRKLQTYAKERGVRRRKLDLNANVIRENLWVFVNATIANPAFDTQTKQALTTNIGDFGSRCELSDDFIEKVVKLGVLERASRLNEFRDAQALTRSSGKKTRSLRGIPKLDDANLAGTGRSLDCTLILTEGDSAKALAIAGLTVVGRDLFGVFPLKGKPQNVRELTDRRVGENEEIANIVRILGLEYGKRYESLADMRGLRYGHLMVMTDQDVDGSHIKGLLMNLFHTYWPTLLRVNGFFITLATPIVKARRSGSVVSFYTLSEYTAWKDQQTRGRNGQILGWEIKYYKGLATSTAPEAREYFTDLSNKIIRYIWDTDQDHRSDEVEEQKADADLVEAGLEVRVIGAHPVETCDQAMLKAFDKRLADDRKRWLSNYDPDAILDQSQKDVLVSEFINLDLKHFSNYDNIRSIPSMVDGLKPSQRKVLYTVFERNLRSPIKVATLAGSVQEMSAYHHGEASLNGTIIGMTFDFVGSNNVNLLVPDGMVGTRLMGGKDAGAPRYIFTFMSAWTPFIFPKEDMPLLNYLNDDGTPIEPEFYVPILPMILINGAQGIGTGYSSEIPCYNPLEIVENIRQRLSGRSFQAMEPWYRGFRGRTERIASGYKFYGNYELDVSKQSIRVTELPVGTWTQNYREYLEQCTVGGSEDRKMEPFIEDVLVNTTEAVVDFTVQLTPKIYDEMRIAQPVEWYRKMRLTDTVSTQNMHLFNYEGQIQLYRTVEEIMEDHFRVRWHYYVLRKEYQLKKLRRDLGFNQSRRRFIQDVTSDQIVLLHKEDEEVEQQLSDREYPQYGTWSERQQTDMDPSWDYLLSMPVRTMTAKKMRELDQLIADIEEKIRQLESTTETQIWLRELDAFVEVYHREMEIWNERMFMIAPTPKASGRGAKNGRRTTRS